jgi:hypothetical protein
MACNFGGSANCRIFKAIQIFPEAEFLDVFGTKVLRFFLLAIYSHHY